MNLSKPDTPGLLAMRVGLRRENLKVDITIGLLSVMIEVMIDHALERDLRAKLNYEVSFNPATPAMIIPSETTFQRETGS